jgi:hypothetical protein
MKPKLYVWIQHHSIMTDWRVIPGTREEWYRPAPLHHKEVEIVYVKQKGVRRAPEYIAYVVSLGLTAAGFKLNTYTDDQSPWSNTK